MTALPRVTQQEHAEHGAITRAEVRDANCPRSPVKVETYAYWDSPRIDAPVMTIMIDGNDLWLIDKRAWAQLVALAEEAGLNA